MPSQRLIASQSRMQSRKGGGVDMEPCVLHGSNFFTPL